MGWTAPECLKFGRIATELGVDRLALLMHFGGQTQEWVLRSMRLFMAEVAPAFT